MTELIAWTIATLGFASAVVEHVLARACRKELAKTKRIHTEQLRVTNERARSLMLSLCGETMKVSS